MIESSNNSVLKEFVSLPQFQTAMQANQREYKQLHQMSLYSDLEKIEKLRTFEKLQASSKGDTVYGFYGMFLPRYKKYEDKVFLTLIKILEKQLPTLKGNYSILFFNTLCEGYDAYMGFKNMLRRFPQKYFEKLSKVFIIHPQKSLTTVQWLSFGVVNKFINKITVFIKNIDDLAKYNFNPSYLHVTLPKEITNFDNKENNQIEERKSPAQKQIKQNTNKSLHQHELSEIGIPVSLRTLLSYFEAKPEKLKLEGIFRKNASVNDINLLTKHVLRKNYEVLFLMEDPYPICALIKNFFNNLKEPLFSYDAYKKIVNTSVEQYETLAIEILRSLPILQYKTLLLLLGFMVYRVVSEQKYNKMSIYNVSVCLAPCLFKPEQYKNQDIVHAGKFIAFLMKVMGSFQKYFSSRNQQSRVYRQEAQPAIKQLKKMIPKSRKTSMSNNLQSRIPSKPSRINFVAQNQQQ